MFIGEHSLYLRHAQYHKGCTRIDLMGNISVVIPTLNEEKFIGSLLDQLQVCTSVAEIIVSDGGSTDTTEHIANQYEKVKYVKAPKGRATQMNAGAAYAKNDFLLFLHADSEVDVNGIQSIIPTLSNDTQAGSFYLAFDDAGFWLNLYSRISKSDWTIFTYGDQGLFIRKELFDKVNGFREIPIMEDLDIVRRVKRHGKFKKINFPVTTCARRFNKNGVVLQQLKNVGLVSLYYLGVSPVWLSKFYRY